MSTISGMSCTSEVIFLFFSLSSLLTNHQEEREKTKKEKMISEIYRSFDDDTTSIAEKILMRQVQRHQRILQNNEQSGPQESFKDVEAHLSLARLCGPLWSLLIFLYHYICIVNIFLTIPIILSSKFLMCLQLPPPPPC